MGGRGLDTREGEVVQGAVWCAARDAMTNYPFFMGPSKKGLVLRGCGEGLCQNVGGNARFCPHVGGGGGAGANNTPVETTWVVFMFKGTKTPGYSRL